MRKYNINASIIRAIEICITKPRVQSCSMVAQKNGSELQHESDKGVYFHQSKKISNDQELIQSDPISCPQNQKGNN